MQLTPVCAQDSIIFHFYYAQKTYLDISISLLSVYGTGNAPGQQRGSAVDSRQPAPGTTATASRYWHQSGGGAGRGNTSNTFIPCSIVSSKV